MVRIALHRDAPSRSDPKDEGNCRRGRHCRRTASRFPTPSPDERSGHFRLIRVIAVPTGPRLRPPHFARPHFARPLFARPLFARPLFARPLFARPLFARPPARWRDAMKGCVRTPTPNEPGSGLYRHHGSNGGGDAGSTGWPIRGMIRRAPVRSAATSARSGGAFQSG